MGQWPKGYPESWLRSTFPGYIGIMENKVETAIGYCGYVGIMENKVETIILLSRTCMATRLTGWLEVWGLGV